MYEFMLLSRTGQTDGRFKCLAEAGMLDIVYQCILTSIFKSHGHRRDVEFHTILNGPPDPPKHLEISGQNLRDARIDERTWEDILRKVLSGGAHPGISVNKASLQSLIKSRHETDTEIFVLEEKGENIGDVDFGASAVFVLGDHIGLPKKDEKFVLRYGRKLSLGRQRYLAASCIDIINYTLDNYSASKLGIARP
jgi:tRNA (pseudouridine54-N1)-methyltransferase